MINEFREEAITRDEKKISREPKKKKKHLQKQRDGRHSDVVQIRVKGTTRNRNSGSVGWGASKALAPSGLTKVKLKSVLEFDDDLENW